MKWVLLLLFIPYLASANDFARCEGLKDDCEYYSCINEVKQCPNGSYPLSFGRRYCLRYSKRQYSFSPAGQRWIADVKRCLIEDMMNFEGDLSCQGLRFRAFRGHVACYVENGFCDLKLKDKKQILKTIWPSLKNLSVLKDGFRVLKNCRYRKHY